MLRGGLAAIRNARFHRDGKLPWVVVPTGIDRRSEREDAKWRACAAARCPVASMASNRADRNYHPIAHRFL